MTNILKTTVINKEVIEYPEDFILKNLQQKSVVRDSYFYIYHLCEHQSAMMLWNFVFTFLPGPKKLEGKKQEKILRIRKIIISFLFRNVNFNFYKTKIAELFEAAKDFIILAKFVLNF